jgi:hypothetical protein
VTCCSVWLFGSLSGAKLGCVRAVCTNALSLACFTLTDAACTTSPRQAEELVVGTLVSYRPLAHVR